MFGRNKNRPPPPVPTDPAATDDYNPQAEPDEYEPELNTNAILQDIPQSTDDAAPPAGAPGAVRSDSAPNSEGQFGAMDAANPESIEDAELIELIHMLNRNWSMIAFYTILGGAIGWLLYIFTGWLEMCWIMVMGCFVLACIVDVIWGERNPKLKLLTINDVDDEDEGIVNAAFNEGRDDQCRFYIKSDFVHYWFDSLHWKFRQYYIGTTTISVVGQAMTLRFKGVDRVFGYRGYESGVVFGFILSNIIWVEIVFKTELTGNPTSTLILKICMYFWLWAIFSIIAAVIERELRSRRFIPPIAIATDLLEVIRVDEISSYVMDKQSWWLVVDRMKPSNPNFYLVVQRVFYRLYKLLMYAIFFVIFVIRSLFQVFWYNSLFAMFVIDTIAIGFLFAAHMEKAADYRLVCAVSFCFVGVFLGVYSIYWYLTGKCGPCQIGRKEAPQLEEDRVPEQRDRMAFLVISVLALIFFFVALILLSLATQELNLIQWKAQNWELPKDAQGRTMLQHLSCQDPTNRRRLPAVFGPAVGSAVYKAMCADNVYFPMAGAAWLLGINWWMLLIAAYVYQTKDPFNSSAFPVNKREWTTYTWVELRSVKRWSFGQQDFVTWLSSYWQVHPGFPIAIPLSNEDADALEEFMQENCAIFQGGKK